MEDYIISQFEGDIGTLVFNPGSPQSFEKIPKIPVIL
jgi:hypothetical protein